MIRDNKRFFFFETYLRMRGLEERHYFLELEVFLSLTVSLTIEIKKSEIYFFVFDFCLFFLNFLWSWIFSLNWRISTKDLFSCQLCPDFIFRSLKVFQWRRIVFFENLNLKFLDFISKKETEKKIQISKNFVKNLMWRSFFLLKTKRDSEIERKWRDRCNSLFWTNKNLFRSKKPTQNNFMLIFPFENFLGNY